jgi:hypothetical protein
LFLCCLLVYRFRRSVAHIHWPFFDGLLPGGVLSVAGHG